VPLGGVKRAFLGSLDTFGVGYEKQDAELATTFPASDPPKSVAPGANAPVESPRPTIKASAPLDTSGSVVSVQIGAHRFELKHGSIVIAAITSCTDTSNPSIMIAAGLLAKKATVGYGCTTCTGNSGPLPEPISTAITSGVLIVCSVLSGNRNFEADSSGGKGELSRLAAARRGVRDPRSHRYRSDDGAAGPGRPRPRRLSQRSLADGQRGGRADRAGSAPEELPSHVCRRLHR
jgi:Aconitase family (aconitate hydratase)